MLAMNARDDPLVDETNLSCFQRNNALRVQSFKNEASTQSHHHDSQPRGSRYFIIQESGPKNHNNHAL